MLYRACRRARRGEREGGFANCSFADITAPLASDLLPFSRDGMPLDTTLIDELAASSPKMRVQWRTRPTSDGWKAQCCAGLKGGITPIWAGKGSTEQEALDQAVGHANCYWAEWATRGERWNDGGGPIPSNSYSRCSPGGLRQNSTA